MERSHSCLFLLYLQCVHPYTHRVEQVGDDRCCLQLRLLASEESPDTIRQRCLGKPGEAGSESSR